MNLKLQIIQATDFIKATRKGEVDLAASKRALALVARAAGEMDDCQILVDARKAVHRHSMLDVWELAEDFKKCAALKGRKVALLVSADSEERAEFFKTCTQNRGYHLNVFLDYEGAIDWLFCPQDLRAA